MPAEPIETGYNPVSKLLHWSMAAIWIAAWGLGVMAVYLRDLINTDHGVTIAHKAIATTILFLVVLRVAWRLTHPAPPLPDSMSPLLQRAAQLGHLGLYAVALIALPVSGWLMSSVADKPIMVLWLFHLPPLVEPAKAWVETARLVHTTLAWTMGAVVLGHILIALKHHYIDRDGILAGMLPGRAAAPARAQLEL